MKVVYEEGELKRLDESYAKLREMGLALLFDSCDPDIVYNLNFKVTNPSLAEYLLVSLLNNKLPDFELGIDITSINFDAVVDKSDLRKKLHEAIDELV